MRMAASCALLMAVDARWVNRSLPRISLSPFFETHTGHIVCPTDVRNVPNGGNLFIMFPQTPKF
jgi:hypothetical protein